MEKANKDIFEDAAVVPSEQIGKDAPISTDVIEETEEDNLVEDPAHPVVAEEEATLVPIIASKSQAVMEKEKGVRKNCDGRILTIESVKINPPKTKSLKNGQIVKVVPQKTKQTGAEFYSSKLVIRFAEENLVEYYPAIRFWVRDGKINPYVKIDRTGQTKVANIFKLAMEKMSKGAFTLKVAKINERDALIPTVETEGAFEAFSKSISDQQILDWLPGKKVKIEVSSGTYDGKKWERNDIKEFIQ